MATSNHGPKDATPLTRAHNRAVLEALPFGDTQDFEDARGGFLATLPEVEIKNEQGRVVWSLREYAFLGEDHAPPTVNPSLWRQARLNLTHGLFQVTGANMNEGASALPEGRSPTARRSTRARSPTPWLLDAQAIRRLF